MIGKLTGRLEYRAPDHVMIDVRGVGYIVYCSDRTLASLPSVGEAVQLYTELLVREDLMQLFGFTSLVEKEWHRLLTSVQGVGVSRRRSFAYIPGRPVMWGSGGRLRSEVGILCGVYRAPVVRLNSAGRPPGPRLQLRVKRTGTA